MLKPFGPYPYIKDASDPILVMTFKTWDKIIYFPDVIVDFQRYEMGIFEVFIEGLVWVEFSDTKINATSKCTFSIDNKKYSIQISYFPRNC